MEELARLRPDVMIFLPFFFPPFSGDECCFEKLSVTKVVQVSLATGLHGPVKHDNFHRGWARRPTYTYEHKDMASIFLGEHKSSFENFGCDLLGTT